MQSNSGALNESDFTDSHLSTQLSNIFIRGYSMISLMIDGKERVCLAQISNTLLKGFSYNEIHNRRVALGINCIQCTPMQLELLRNAGAMPISSRRCGMITRREAERLVKSFLDKNKPPNLPEKFFFEIQHKCGYGCQGTFFPSRYNSSRAKCIQCSNCGLFSSPNKFIFHSHKTIANSVYLQTGTVNFNSWRRHITLINPSNDEYLANAWEDVKSIFNSGKRKRTQASAFKISENCLEEDDNFVNDGEDDELSETENFEKEENGVNSSNNELNQYSHPTSSSNEMTLLNLINPFYVNSFQMMRFFPGLFQKVLNNETANVNSLKATSGHIIDNGLCMPKIELNRSQNSFSAFRSINSSGNSITPLTEIKKKGFFSIIDHLEKK